MQTTIPATSSLLNLIPRPRRNRKSPAVRELVQENRLHPHQLIAPLFILEGNNQRTPIKSMPGVDRLSLDLLLKEAEALYTSGIRAVDLFPVIPPNLKDGEGSEAVRENNLVQRAVRALKSHLPDLCVMVDLALDPYTDHGHDGLIDDEGRILNDPTVLRLGEMALGVASSGADVVAPSDMMDGRVLHLRQVLDDSGFQDVSILSYTAKYASAFYGPFRDALGSAPKFGDKKTYQMNPANGREALLEAALDEAEGADLLLVKPGLPYLDVLAKIKETSSLPVGAYQVSGEYAMIMAAGEKGWLDPEKAMMEALTCIRRAGADFILTYAAKWAADRLLKFSR